MVDQNMGTSSKLEEMLRKQKSNFKAFSRTIISIDCDSLSEKWEFDDAIKLIDSRWSAIDNLHWEIDSEVYEENVDYEHTFTQHEREYNSIKKTLNQKMWSASYKTASTPTMDIPNFLGDYHQWVSFKNLFEETIHKNRSMSNAQKMQFLKSKIKGEAEKLIQHLNISSDNYQVCWDILNHRYHNLKLIFSSHVNIMLSLPTMQQQTASLVKKIHDTTKESLNAIKNLGVDVTTWDPLIVHILTQKLDAETHKDYIESLKSPRELPSLSDFLEFLECKFTSLEVSRRKQDSNIQKAANQNSSPYSVKRLPQQQNNFNFNKHHTSDNYSKPIANSYHVSSAYKCLHCKGDHSIFYCNEFLNLPNTMKLKVTNDLRLCTNCLYDHKGNKCISNKTCRKCPELHNTLLHDTLTKPLTSSTQEPSKENVNVSQNNSSEILLATALIKVQAADGSYHSMRALIDQGSQISLITENAAQKLGLPRRHCKGVVFGLGTQENSSKGAMNISVSATHGDFSFNANVVIMANLINNLPNQSFQQPTWPHIENIRLADPQFYVSRPVDILLGADIYALIMMGAIIKGENESQPMAQQTRLGWLLCGNVKTYQCNVIINNQEDTQQFSKIEQFAEIPLSKSTATHHSSIHHHSKPDTYEKIGESNQKAVLQLLQVEKKITRSQNIPETYKSVIEKHHPVYKPNQDLQTNVATTSQDDVIRDIVNRHSSFVRTTRVPAWVLRAGSRGQAEHPLSILEKPQNSEKKKTNKQSNISSSIKTMAIILLTIMFILPTYCAHNIAQLSKNQSIYFDKISDMHLSRDEWKLVVYYNMQPYWEGAQMLTKCLDSLRNICDKSDKQLLCDVIMLQIRHGYKELDLYNHMLLGQQIDSAHSRARRGLINGIGNLAHTLFGVLDDQFVEQYQKDIELLRKNQKHMALLWRNQTSIVEAQHNLLQRVEDTMDQQHKYINKHLNKLEQMANSANEKIQNSMNNNNFALSAIIANTILQNLRNIQDYLLDTIVDLHYGSFNIHLISPEQFRDELNIISGQLDKDLSLPINNIATDLPKLYHMLKIKAKMTKQYFIFEIKIPLVARDYYEIYRLIPTHHGINSSMINIIPISEYIAMNMQKDSYFPMTHADLLRCDRYNDVTYLCPLQRPVYHMTSDKGSCIMNDVTNQCAINTEPCRTTWSELYAVNTHLYSCCGQCNVRIICGSQVTAETLTGNGIISLSGDCIIKSADFTIFSHRQQTNSLNVEADVIKIDIPSINHIIELPISVINNTSIADQIKYDNHTYFHQRFNEIGKQIQQMKASEVEDILNDRLSPHDVTQYGLISTIAILIICVTLAFAWLRRRRIRSSSNISEPSSRPASPAARAVARPARGQQPQPAARPLPHAVRIHRHATGRTCTTSRLDISDSGDNEIDYPRYAKIDKATSPSFVNHFSE